MHRIDVYIILLVIGALLGASITSYVTINQNPSTREQVKEFLKSSKSKKGILVILSEDRGRVHERAQEHSGTKHSGVHVIII